jgi:hypothetical protein
VIVFRSACSWSVLKLEDQGEKNHTWMPAPPPESEPAIVSIVGVLIPICIRNGFIVVNIDDEMMGIVIILL